MDLRNNSNQGPTYNPYSGLQGYDYAPRSEFNSDAACYKQTEPKDQGIFLYKNSVDAGRDDEGMAVNASPQNETCSYVFSIWFALLINIVGLFHFSSQVSHYLIVRTIYNVISACFTLLMLVTLIYGLVAHYGKKQGRQVFFISSLQLSVAIFLLDIPLLFIFGDSTSMNIRIVAILTSLFILYIAKKC